MSQPDTPTHHVTRTLLETLTAGPEDASFELLNELNSSTMEYLPPRTSAPDGSWHRWQDPIIEQIVPAHASVLDLGCGNGDLLARLMLSKSACAQGVELSQEAVIRCIERGVPVFHGNLDAGLAGFQDQSFDIVVLEETLQTLHHPLRVLDEMLRVGRQGIVSFPNFAYWRVRVELGLGGRMPITGSLPFHWHDTPNIHLLSICDFLDWALAQGVEVTAAHVLAQGQVRQLQPGDNLMAKEVLFVVQRPATSDCATAAPPGGD